jgi:gamma-glutamyl-gamma-aminobutyrate hydrolase PuuD
MSSRSTIGITIGYESSETFALSQAYVRSVEQAGGQAIVLAPGTAADAVFLLERCDGLLLTGGADMDPALLGEERHPAVTRFFRERDEFELALCRAAVERDLALFAICRGTQLLNVALGGSLYQDLATQLPGSLKHNADGARWATTHEVDLLPGSRIRAILGRERVAVNSLHHQAVRSPGRELQISAVSSGDRVVEAVEAPGRRFVLGVQWHPEDFWNHGAAFAPLFASFLEATR